LINVRDDELVAAALEGDPAAFATLVDRNRSRVDAVVGRMVGEEAEDIVQEALLRAYLGLSQLRDPQRFGAWLCGIAVNLAKMLKGVKTPFRHSSVDSGVVAAYIVALDSGTLCSASVFGRRTPARFHPTAP
jgi:hypothetical protein